MANKKLTVSLAVILTISVFGSFTMVFGLNYDEDTSVSEVDGYMWRKMNPEERKSFVLAFSYMMSIMSEEEDFKLSVVPLVARKITSAYEETGNWDKSFWEIIDSISGTMGGTPEISDSKAESPRGEEVIVEYSGSGMKTTRPFTVDSSWELQWEASGMVFQVYLQSEDGRMVDILANQQGEGEGSSYSPKTGTYYLEINAMGDWEIKIVEVK